MIIDISESLSYSSSLYGELGKLGDGECIDRIKGKERAALISWLLTKRGTKENYGDLVLPRGLF